MLIAKDEINYVRDYVMGRGIQFQYVNFYFILPFPFKP